MEDDNKKKVTGETAMLFDCSKFGFGNYISVRYGDLNRTHDAVLAAECVKKSL